MISSLIVPLLAGFASGGAVNFVADTLPRTRRLSRPACVQCGSSYSWTDYLLYRNCRNCGHKRGFRPWVVLVAMLALSLFAWFQPHPMGFWLGMLLLTYFALVVVIDLEHRLIMHPTSAVGALLALGIGLWLHGLLPTLLGGLSGLGIMLTLYYLGVLFARLRSRRLAATGAPEDHEEALGAGDVILAGVLGLALGWPLIWFALLLGILFGGVLGLILLTTALVRGRYGSQALMIFMPYGPAFIVSAFLVLFFPTRILGLVPR